MSDLAILFVSIFVILLIIETVRAVFRAAYRRWLAPRDDDR